MKGQIVASTLTTPRADDASQVEPLRAPEPLPRDKKIRAIRRQGRPAWKKPAAIIDDPSSKPILDAIIKSLGATRATRILAN